MQPLPIDDIFVQPISIPFMVTSLHGVIPDGRLIGRHSCRMRNVH